jgi:hypothetical protein
MPDIKMMAIKTATVVRFLIDAVLRPNSLGVWGSMGWVRLGVAV